MEAPPQGPGVSFGEALRFWLALGFISFGGPAGQIAIMHRELVERRRWISEDRFLHALNYCMLLPGPEAQQLATYSGWLLHGGRGGLAAGTLFVLPSIFVLLALSYVYAAHGSIPAVAGVLDGFRPVVIAVVCDAVVRIGGRALRGRTHLAIAAAAFTAIYVLSVPFPVIIAAAALAGWLGGPILASRPAVNLPPPRAGTRASRGVAHSAGPAHRRPVARSAWVLGTGVGMWVLGLACIAALRGPASVHAEVYRFFTKVALVTFGGAYAVLAYVAQAAADRFGWLTHAEMLDGLALAETTPGPLIMVVQFVGFMAGWRDPEGLTPAASAVTSALITTYVTFLPCFLFIFLGAPSIERLRGHHGLSAALAGVTAAVVGVILNLALVFGTAVLLPHGLAGGVDLPAVLLTLAAFVALRRLHVNVAWVVLGGGLAGAIGTLVGG